MTAVDGFRSVLVLLSPLSPLSVPSRDWGISREVMLIVFGIFVDLIEPRIPVGIGILAFSDLLVGGGTVRRKGD